MADPVGTRVDAAWAIRMGVGGIRVLGLVLVLALVFTMVNVQQFAAAGQPLDSFQWWIAWLLDPMASITMGAAIVYEGLLADFGRTVGWLTATKWYAGIATWAMNIWVSLVGVVPSGVLLHSVAPGLVLLLAEAAPRVRAHLAEITVELIERDATRSTLDEAQPGFAAAVAVGESATGPVPVPAPEALPALHRQLAAPPVPGAPTGPSPAVRAATAGTDPVTVRVRELIERTGRIPGRRIVARELGITEHQARTALQRVTTAPVSNRVSLNGVRGGR